MMVAEVHGLGGRQGDLRALLDELSDGSVREPECVEFRVLAAQDPGEFVVLASWTSEAALRAHYDTPHYRHYREEVGLLLARPSDVVVHQLAATIHALDPNPPDAAEFG
jgi:quinol monooxygenase YgiN